MECLFGGKVERCPLCFNLTRMFKKTGSRLKPPHRIVTDLARTPVGRDDTALGLGVACLRVGYSIYIGCLSLYSVFNLC